MATLDRSSYNRSVQQDDGLQAMLPAAFTWADYVERWAIDCGGWMQLADVLMQRAGEAAGVPQDLQTVERGLRRLARRSHKAGGQYGRWMLRYLGFATPVEDLVKWMGQYHTRFSDLPSGLRLQHLQLWNRPPISESRYACWILVGIAHAQVSRADLAACEEALAQAERLAPRAGPAAEIEVGLLRAQLETDAGRHAVARQRQEQIAGQLSALRSPTDERAYRAALQHQRALHCTRPRLGETADVVRAQALYEAIDELPYVPFVSFRKCAGLAYCAWQLGDVSHALWLAEQAVEHAGDGGLMRMRVMALNMLSRTLSGVRAASVNARARRMALLLEDEDLLSRVSHCAPAA